MLGMGYRAWHGEMLQGCHDEIALPTAGFHINSLCFTAINPAGGWLSGQNTCLVKIGARYSML